MTPRSFHFPLPPRRLRILSILALAPCLGISSADTPSATDGGQRLAECLAPIWQPGTQHNESVLLWARDGERPSAPLLFHADKILSVRDSALETVYEEGRDWIYRDGKLVLPEGSRVPWMSAAELFPSEPGAPKPRTTFPRRSGGYLLFREGNFFHQRQIAVTYRHHATPRLDNFSAPQIATKNLPRSLAKLRAREPFTIIAYGDSITVGANASGFGKTPVAPHQPVWTELFRRWLARACAHDSVTLRNKAVGGKGSAWGMQNADSALGQDPADLVIIAFGMNDRGMHPGHFHGHILRIMEAARKANPEVEFILVQSMLNNPDWQSHGNLPAFGKILQKLAGPGVAFCDMAAVHSAFLKRKRYEDMTGNHVNHPNDFLIRAYAQTVAAQLAPLP